MESMFRGTTICGVKRDGKIAIAGDGQVTLSESVIFKSNAHKVKRIYNDEVVVGFAGSVSDALSLCERFENMLNKSRKDFAYTMIDTDGDVTGDILQKLEGIDGVIRIRVI